MKLDDRIVVINKLLEEGSVQSLTYAALECRLTIEKICYERLRISYDHLSFNDLKGWSPKKVVDYIVEEANEYVASNMKISVSSPLEEGDNIREKEYISLGMQSGFSISKLARLWQALSNISLHVRLPESKQDEIQVYSPEEKIREKVTKALCEFENINKGNMIVSGFLPDVSFECIDCGTPIKKKNMGNLEGKLVSCFNKDCTASYIISFKGDEVFFGKRTTPITCEKCSDINDVDTAILENLDIRQVLKMTCKECGHISNIMLRPCLVKLSNPSPPFPPSS